MRIKRVRIQNYKSMYDSMDINVTPDIFALIGQNNAGKSTILDAIQCLMSSSGKKVEEKDFYNKNEAVKIEILFDDISDEYIEHVLSGGKFGKNMQIEDAKNKWHIIDGTMLVKHNVKLDKGSIERTFNIGDEDVNITETNLKKILPEIKVIPAIRNPENEGSAGSKSYLKDLIEMLDNNSKTSITFEGKALSYNEISGILEDESKKRCKALSAKISEKYSESIGNVAFDISIEPTINLSKGTSYETKIIDRMTGTSNNMLNCGTGYQSMVILAMLETFVDIANHDKEYILLIEEPEVYLHPTLQRKMIETLIRLSKFNQVLFSTHSAIMIGLLEKEQVALVTKKSGKSKVEEIDVSKVINELGIRPDDVLIKKDVIIVEGFDDKKVISEIIRKIDEKALSKIEVIAVDGCKHMKFYADAQFLFNSVYEPHLLIIRDADDKTEEEQKENFVKEIENVIKDKSKNISKNVFIVGKHSIESYFIIDEIISEMANIDLEEASKFVEIYNNIYDYKKEISKNGKTFSSIYQPKYLLEVKYEKHEDKKEQYYKAFEELNISNKYNWFMDVQSKIAEYTYRLKKEGKDYMIEIIQSMSLEKMENNLFKALVVQLTKFISEI